MSIESLKDTCELMTCDDWRARLKAEFWQNSIRRKKLESAVEQPMFHKEQYAEELRLMNMQINIMLFLGDILMCRAKLHGLDGYIFDDTEG
jgi:hypothetical protein